MTQTTIQLGDNAEALALAGEHDANLKVLERALDCQVALRGDQLRLSGEDAGVKQAVDVVGELLTVIRSGRPVDAGTVESLIDIAVSENGKPSEVYGDIVWTHRGRQIGPRTTNQKALRRRHPHQHHHLRHRSGGHRQDLPRHGHGRRGLLGERRGAHHPHPAGGRGGREAGLSARRLWRRSTPTCARCSTRSTT